MINFLAYGKEVRLRNGRILTVKRLAIGHYYLLIASVIIYRNALEITAGATDIKKADEYIKFLRENAMNIAKVKVEWDNIVKYLEGWVENAEVDKLDKEEVFEVLNAVIDFNSIRSEGGNPIKSVEGLSDQFEDLIGTVALVLKMEPQRIVNTLNNYEVTVIVREYNRMRVQSMNDLRYAQNANREEYAKYTGKLLGEKVISGDDIFKNPNLLNEVH